ncbi:MAG TPA: DUF2851 family protein [Tepidiformaceae bacterium]|nr:DUF2851 family protein [Tepidiformaceae bacterium]
MKPARLPERESALAARWFAGIRGPLRLEDGRSLHVVFPGVPGAGPGPDATGAILDAAGDLLRGDVEFHLLASGWEAHGHPRDPAYTSVVLHVVAHNDSRALSTHHSSGRAIPLLVLPPAGQGQFPPPFTPPCSIAAHHVPVLPTLERLALRRLRMKAARAQPLIAATSPANALYALLLETLAGPANRAAFASLARRLPLAALLASVDDRPSGASRTLALTAALRGEAASLSLRRAGLRPMASPARRLESAARLVALLWPSSSPAWPAALAHPLDPRALLRTLRVEGIGRPVAIELAVNAVLPVALASGLLPESAAHATLRALPSPGTYGRLRRLESWLATGSRPFTSAAALQGALLLHNDYCTAGRCGRCPLSS